MIIKDIGLDPESGEPVDLTWDGGFYVYETKVENEYLYSEIVLRFTPSFKEKFHYFDCITNRFVIDEDIYSDSYCKLIGHCYSFDDAYKFINNFSKNYFITEELDYRSYKEVELKNKDFSDLKNIVVFKENYKAPFRQWRISKKKLLKDEFYLLGKKYNFIEEYDDELIIAVDKFISMHSRRKVYRYIYKLYISYDKNKENKVKEEVINYLLEKDRNKIYIGKFIDKNYINLFDAVCKTFYIPDILFDLI